MPELSTDYVQLDFDREGNYVWKRYTLSGQFVSESDRAFETKMWAERAMRNFNRDVQDFRTTPPQK